MGVLMKRIKIIQILIVIFLIISAFFLGKLSMTKQLNNLNERIDQLEIQINQE